MILDTSKNSINRRLRERTRQVIQLLDNTEADFTQVLDSFFPKAETDLIVQGFKKEEFIDLLESLIITSEFTMKLRTS